MKLNFKVQPYQTAAVEAVVDCFEGQSHRSATTYAFDFGLRNDDLHQQEMGYNDLMGFKNNELEINPKQLLDNIHDIQRRNNLTLSESIIKNNASQINLDVEMETGTGKTYCYIKTIFELNKRYGWSKFIIVVPSIAIREGVYKSLQITAEHFAQYYDGQRAKFFIYNSEHLTPLESFSSDSGINVMVINIQAFNARGNTRGNAQRRIYEELDEFQSRRPIDVIKANRPILIIDEPQKMEGKKTLESLQEFNPLMILRYSATHKTEHNKIYRLDALDAYEQKLVKRISVRGISVSGAGGLSGYLYVDRIEVSKDKAPVAFIEIEIKLASGKIKRDTLRFEVGDRLHERSNELGQYKDCEITNIDPKENSVELTDGTVLYSGEAIGDVSQDLLRRLQIKETIKAHLEKERDLFKRGIKVLSLFFIDQVVKYRDYSQEDEKGDYARYFEEEYTEQIRSYLKELGPDESDYYDYLSRIDVSATHNGYFSIDKRNSQFKDPVIQKSGELAGQSNDVDAYDLILRDKERLLSFEEPTRFIFSHSALREGWDNPNVFVMCMLKHSDNTISRRQEVGRGLRLSVDQNGDRQDNPVTVHDINVLTVVANESYQNFVSNLQREIKDSLSDRPLKANQKFFEGKQVQTENGPVTIDSKDARKIYHWLIRNDYIDEHEELTDICRSDLQDSKLAKLPPELVKLEAGILDLLTQIDRNVKGVDIVDDRNLKENPLNKTNFEKKEFQALWKKINHKAIYRVDFDSDELVHKCIQVLDKSLKVSSALITVTKGSQGEDEVTEKGMDFRVKESQTQHYETAALSTVRYDLVGELSINCMLTRKTIGRILTGIEDETFEQFKNNPEQFIAKASQLIKEQRAGVIIEKLTYIPLEDKYEENIFTAERRKYESSRMIGGVKKHIYDYVVVDSQGVEKSFVEELDTSNEVVVYAKLPRGFQIPTPVGDYNPDWAICFKEGEVKHIYFVAETKGSLSSLDLRKAEECKIECARKFFERIGSLEGAEKVQYDVVTDYKRLMEIVTG